jgi:hypothetical protein
MAHQAWHSQTVLSTASSSSVITNCLLAVLVLRRVASALTNLSLAHLTFLTSVQSKISALSWSLKPPQEQVHVLLGAPMSSLLAFLAAVMSH